MAVAFGSTKFAQIIAGFAPSSLNIVILTRKQTQWGAASCEFEESVQNWMEMIIIERAARTMRR